MRKATTAAFAPAEVERMKDIVTSNVERLIGEVIDPAAASGESFDVALAMQFTTVRVICEAGFEYAINDDEIRDLLESFRLTYMEYSQTSALAPWRVVLPFLFVEARKAKRASAWLRSLACKMLDNYKSKADVGRTDNNSTTVISAIVADTEYVSDEERISDVVVYLAGGYDTTAYTLSWALLELARNPPEQAYLCRDLNQNTESNSDALNMVVKEVLRLHPTAALGSVRLTSKNIMAGEYTIPKGSFVNVPYFVVHRNEEVFGKDADCFNPRRWAIGKESPPSEAVIPFASGRRNCVGQAMANAELMVILKTICAMFELSVDKEGTYNYFVTWKTDGTRLFVKRR